MRTLLPLLLLSALGCRSDQALLAEEVPPGLSIPPTEVNPIQEDRTVQVIQPVIDILFVVDNSSSMLNEQIALRNNFPRFIDHFVNAGIDYHIGMVSTDMLRTNQSGLLRMGNGYRYIDTETVEPGEVFTQMTSTLGVLLGSIESGRSAAYTALETLKVHPRNDGFLRDEADLHIIFVSDDNDQSGTNPVSKSEFIGWADNLKNDGFEVVMHGIVTPSNPCNGNIVSQDYLDYAAVTGGITYSICAADWAPALDALGLLAAGLKREFFLTRIPVHVPELLLDVQVRTVDENGDPVLLDFVECKLGQEELPGFEDCQVVYVPGRNSIVFLEYVPDPLAEVLVTYGIAENYAAED